MCFINLGAYHRRANEHIVCHVEMRLFELMLVNAERADLRIKRRCRQAEPTGSAAWSINPTTRLPQHRFDLSFSI